MCPLSQNISVNDGWTEAEEVLSPSPSMKDIKTLWLVKPANEWSILLTRRHSESKAGGLE